MELNDLYSPDFLPTALITPRSKFYPLPLSVVLIFSRVLLATIQYFGGCPCPRCLIEKDQIPAMGTKADMRRQANIRKDTPAYRRIIAIVRRWIFEKGFLVAGAAVSRLLKPKSWVPTRVSGLHIYSHCRNIFLYISALCRMLFRSSLYMVLIFSACLYRISFTKSSLEGGNPSLCI
jgi:hypothetical protein